jgi:uncharacterized protein (DUF2252 family)
MKTLEMTSTAARAAAGKALRERVPRAAHGTWTPAADRRDPNAILAEVAAGRLPYLIPLRNERMAESPFTFYRGAAAVMAADLATTEASGLMVQACGDAHCLNFGGFATAERRVIFDVVDFDETAPGPWEWDVKRMITSFILAGRSCDHKERQNRIAALASVEAYRTRMRELAAMSALDVWYTRLDANAILDEARTAEMRLRRKRIAEESTTATIMSVFRKFTEETDGRRQFIERAPDLFHSTETDRPGFDVEEILAHYLTTLTPELQFLMSRYILVDHAIKVVGVGSVGTRCAIALYMADDHDPLILQIKEAVPSVLECAFPLPEPMPAGRRVVHGQRMMQAASDAFLGWGSSGTHDFYVRQFKDMKASANLDGASPADLCEYAEYCGWALAAAHARSGDAAAIAGYIGRGDAFDRALLAFALTYAELTEADYTRFTAAA